MSEIKTSEQITKVVSEFGKFESAEKLLKAYESLEQEFTKRCQKLKDVQEKLDNFEIEKTSNLSGTLEAVESLLSDDDFLRERIIGDEKIKDLIISAYLNSLLKSEPSRLLGARVGVSALAPINKPKTLQDAKKLADKLLRS